MDGMAVELLTEEKGVTTIEYAIIASLIAMALVISLTNIGDKLATFYQSVVNVFP